ncbi:hypothetical protein ACROYT_G031133 [Oculina patagonica]
MFSYRRCYCLCTFVLLLTSCSSLYYMLITFLPLRGLHTVYQQTKNTERCKPLNHIFFLKMHKTGSSTLANMLYRYGEDRNLTFVLPQKPISFHWPKYFHLSNMMPLYTDEGKILCGHTRYNKGPVNLLFPKHKSKYITILRNPFNHFESVFNFFKFFDALRLGNRTNPIRSFLRNPPTFTQLNFTRFLYLIRNPSMFNLGLDYKYYQNRGAVTRFIKFVDQEFDLILINEYFDESLILLKSLLCWDFEDILYLKQKVRTETERTPLSREMKANILSWNQADALLYNHFNRTLWRKILEAGPKFYEDLRFFRERNKILEENCVLQFD